VDVDFLAILLYFCSDLWVHDVRLIQMINDVINALYFDICSYILITIVDVTSCMYCGIHVGAPNLLLKLGVTYKQQTWS
jgi:hypothetical protein